MAEGAEPRAAGENRTAPVVCSAAIVFSIRLMQRSLCEAPVFGEGWAKPRFAASSVFRAGWTRLSSFDD